VSSKLSEEALPLFLFFISSTGMLFIHDFDTVIGSLFR